MVLSPQMMTATVAGQDYWLFKVKMRVIFQPQFFLFRHSGPAGTLTKLPATGLLYVAKDMLGREGVVKIDTGVVDAVDIATVALKCLNHLFTWVPLSTVISPRLLAAIFHFAGLGIPCVNVSPEHKHQTFDFLPGCIFRTLFSALCFYSTSHRCPKFSCSNKSNLAQKQTL